MNSFEGEIILEYVLIPLIVAIATIIDSIVISQVKLGETDIVSPSRFTIKRIILQGLFVGLIITLIFSLVYHQYGNSTEAFSYLFLTFCLLLASHFDFIYRIIPNRLNLIIGMSGVCFLLFNHTISWKSGLIGGLIGGGLLYLLNLLSLWFYKKEGMGGGDIKLAAAAGLYLGIGRIICTFYLSSMVALIYVFINLITGRIKKEDYIPYGPFLSIGMIITILYYKEILVWYEQLCWG